MKYLALVLIVFASCDSVHRYTSKEIASVKVTAKNLIGENPSLLSEPFMISDAIENKLIDTPIRLIGRIDEVVHDGFIVKEGGEELMISISSSDIKNIIESKDVLLEGKLSLNDDVYVFNAKTILILN